MRSTGTRPVLAAAAVAALMLTGCSADAAQGGGLTTLTVGVLPGADLAPLYVGLNEGIFIEHGIDLKINSFAATSADIVTAVSEGRYDLGYADTISIFAAQEGGSELQIVSGAATTSGDTRSDYAGIVTHLSDINTIGDLAGRRLSIDALGTTNETVARAAVDAAGADSASMTIEAVPVINARRSLAGGIVDAALLVEPYLTKARLDGLKVISYPYAEFDENLTVSGYFTSSATIDAKSELVESFTTALAAAFEQADADEPAVRTNITTYLGSDAQVRTRLILPRFSTEIDRDSATALAESALGYGLITAMPDFDAMLP
jgi:NitT/TauT family transport system substrate-binding protein